MDPIFYPTSTGLPSESKLATYMVAAQSSEFIPQRSSVSPNFYTSIHQSLTSGGLNGLNNIRNSEKAAYLNEILCNTQAAIIDGTTTTPAPTAATAATAATTTTTTNIPSAAADTIQIINNNNNNININNNNHNNNNNNIIINTTTTTTTISTATTINGRVSKKGILHQLQQQQQQQQIETTTDDLQQQNQTNHSINGNNNIINGQGLASPYIVNNIMHRSLMSDSPHRLLGETKTSPLATPQPSPCTLNTLPANVHQENVGGTIYFYPTANTQNSGNIVNSAVDASTVIATHTSAPTTVAPMTPLPSAHLYAGHIYPGPASHTTTLQPKSQLENAFFMPAEMRSEIQTRNSISNLMLTPLEMAQNQLPLEVDNYHSLYPLENMQPLHGKLAMLTSTYKATHCTTGIKYCLRRLHGFRLQSTKCMTLVEMWKQLNHPNVAQLREVFTTKAFGDNSLVLVYDYFPGSLTLLSKYFTSTMETNGYTDPFQGDARPFSHKSNLVRNNNNLLSESTIWAIIMQLTAGLRAMHQANLACRALDATKIILTGKRVRLSFCGVVDIANFDPNIPNILSLTNIHQQEDLTALGRLVLSLACRNLHAAQRDNVQSSIDLVARNYSADLRNFIVYLFTTQQRSVTDLMPMIGARFYTQLEALQTQCDMYDEELAKELENGRLYRILIKLNFINERPNFNMDVTWSETGDRYMLKLFRDYLFHSVTEDGRPWLDHAHILHCLNKLDAGSMERIQLMSRDEQSLLIVSYSELKNCLENTFAELMANGS